MFRSRLRNGHRDCIRDTYEPNALLATFEEVTTFAQTLYLRETTKT